MTHSYARLSWHTLDSNHGSLQASNSSKISIRAKSNIWKWRRRIFSWFHLNACHKDTRTTTHSSWPSNHGLNFVMPQATLGTVQLNDATSITTRYLCAILKKILWRCNIFYIYAVTALLTFITLAFFSRTYKSTFLRLILLVRLFREASAELGWSRSVLNINVRVPIVFWTPVGVRQLC